MKKTFLTGIVLGTVLLFTGCGSDSKPDGNVPVADQSLTLSLLETVYAGNTGNGTYIARFAVHAVDQSGNPHSNLPLRVSLVNAADSKCYYRGYHGTISTTEPTTFSDYNVDFSKTGTKVGDALIILPTTDRQESTYLGDWKVTKVGANLELGAEPVYNLETMDELSYVVGDEKCLYRGQITNVHAQAPDDSNSTKKTSETDKGLTYFDVVFDESLAGQGVFIGVHVTGMRAGTGGLVILPSSVDTNTTTN